MLLGIETIFFQLDGIADTALYICNCILGKTKKSFDNVIQHLHVMVPHWKIITPDLPLTTSRSCVISFSATEKRL